MKKLLLLFLIITAPAIAQKEANNWFFGKNAGIHFLDDGSVEPLPGGQMVTNEGCSSISDEEGNLLFYTDGRTVWDRNHIIMPNADYFGGTGLLGDPSSTNSAIIVPKKGSPDIYYIFTVDEPHHTNASVYPAQYTGSYLESNGEQIIEQFIPDADDGLNNGLNYSVVDLSITGANGSIGDITDKNIHLLTYDPDDIDQAKYKCSEKITAVKSQNNGFWVVTHFIDTFYAFFVNENGVNTTPVTTQLAPVVPTSGYRRNGIGCIKSSPDGDYLAIVHNQLGTQTGGTADNGVVYLYDFDNNTGTLANPLLIKNNSKPYGIEFSAQSKKLYASFEMLNGYGGLHQYDLLSSNIPASDQLIGDVTGTALQLGPNGKIYGAINGAVSLYVINSPEEDGSACNFINNAIPLPAGTRSVFGLPPFITSLFSGNIVVSNMCFGNTTQFKINTMGSFDSITWDFGDGSPTSTDIEPEHQYAGSGIYTVTATIIKDDDTIVIEKEVTIYVVPVANTAPDLTECDPDNDGITTFSLSDNDAEVLGTQSDADFTVRYFASQADADTNSQVLNAILYSNTNNPQTIYARVQNKGNTDCYAVTSFTINALQAPELLVTEFATCDEDADGDDTNGQVIFDLEEATIALLGDDAPDYTVVYYASQSNAQSETTPLPQQFYNTVVNSQVIYAHITNNTFTNCFSIEPVTLIVNPLPVDIQNAALIQCDTEFNADGITQFNLTEADNYFTNGDADLTVSYFTETDDAENEISALTGAYTNTTNPETVYARVSNTLTGCYRVMPLVLQVNTVTPNVLTMERCDDDGTEDGLAEFTLTDLGLESAGTTVTYYTNVTDALLEQNAVGDTYTNVQENEEDVYARIETNNDCTAIQQIKLIVHPLPDVPYDETAIVCVNTGDYIVLDAGVAGANFTYLWSNGSITKTIIVNQPGTYTVLITDTSHSTLCQKQKTITVLPGDVAVINDILVHDLTDNNTITVLASPASNVDTVYMYSIDEPDGPWQAGNYFENVSPGIHTVYVYDTNGCGIVKKQVAVLGIPNYFTPNADGQHDYWNVIGINGPGNYNSKVYIFDRYGKLITKIKPQSIGWDGTYNGRPMPSTDYWYLIELEDGRTVRGHFSMVR
ncbi:T9SS type B sorting domain-containing protein [Flavobacterium rhizosphaerae]|uniref:T9SS type B sorting domain-containing protein n=1 Tax=Flavobacterium rhizosphaerae TaxID=3163298 RepID=A0ABW8YYT1_9FLAO